MIEFLKKAIGFDVEDKMIDIKKLYNHGLCSKIEIIHFKLNF